MVITEETWFVFEQTGSVEDYLNYLACTKEDTEGKATDDEGRDYGKRDCVISYADGGI